MEVKSPRGTENKNAEVKLEKPKAKLFKDDEASLVKADEALHVRNSKDVYFTKGVSLDHASGLKAYTDSAVLDTKGQTLNGNGNVKADHNNKTITADGFNLDNNSNILNFSKNVSVEVPLAQ